MLTRNDILTINSNGRDIAIVDIRASINVSISIIVIIPTSG
jgi:hypothetical protein